MVISGGTATLLGPIAGAVIVVVMKNVVSAYIERWNLVLGVIFVAHHHLHAGGAGAGLGAAVALGLAGHAQRRPQAGASRGRRGAAAMTALVVNALCKSFGGLRVTARRQPRGRAGRAAADHRPERRRQDHAVQPRSPARSRPTAARSCCSTATSRACRATAAPHLGMARTYQIITLFPQRHHPAQRHAGAARPVAAALESAASTSTSSTT